MRPYRRLLPRTALASVLTAYLMFVWSLLMDRGKVESELSPIQSAGSYLDGNTGTESENGLASRRLLGEQQKTVNSSMLSCEKIKLLARNATFLNAGWNKAVYRAQVGDHSFVAFKTINVKAAGFRECLNLAKTNEAVTSCYENSAKKLLRELYLMKKLSNANVVQLVGYCTAPDQAAATNANVILAAELGDSFTIIHLLQLPWEQRLRIVYDLTKLLAFFAISPLGPIAINDFKRDQFVTVDGTLKLADLDDLGIGDPICSTTTDCLDYTANSTFAWPPIVCHHNVCKGYNDVINIQAVYKNFVSFLLAPGTPARLQSAVREIEKAFKNLSCNTQQLLEMVRSLVDGYRNGSYMEAFAKISEFAVQNGSDLTENDYPCRDSYISGICLLSVHNLTEAQQLCSGQQRCRAFVWTKQKTWLGRTMVYFKDNVSIPKQNIGTLLYVKK